MDTTEFKVPLALEWFFRRAQILTNESPIEYHELVAMIQDAVRPDNALTYLLVRDWAAQMWEIRRLTDMKTNIIKSAFAEALQLILERALIALPDDGGTSAKDYVAAWYKGEEGRNMVLNLLRSRELSEHSVVAEAARLRLSEIEIINRQLDRLRVINIGTLREIESHRAAGIWRAQDSTKCVNAMEQPILSLAKVPA